MNTVSLQRVSRTLGFVSLLVGGLAVAASAELRWDRQRAEVRAGLNDTRVVVGYVFRNVGSEVVTVTSAQSSCGCTIPEMEMRGYRPGESGRLNAVFTFDGKTGWEEKTITVTTDDPDTPVHQLSLRVFIPPFLRYQPSFVLWSQGMERAPRRVRVEVMSDSPIRLTRVIDPSGKFSSEIRVVQEGRLYEVLISPPATGVVADSRLRFCTDTPRTNPRHIEVYVRAN